MSNISKKLRSVGILGVGSYLPLAIKTNKYLEKTLDTNDKWIVEHVGIRERRIVSNDEFTSDLGAKASLEAIKNAGLNPSDINLIIVSTQSGDHIIPSTACMVQGIINAKNAMAFDVNVACSGFIFALAIAEKFIADGTIKHALIVGAESLSRTTNWEDRTTAILFGDGAGAVVLGVVPTGYGILSSYLKSDGSLKDVMSIPAGGTRIPVTEEAIKNKLQYFRMDGKKVLEFTSRVFPEAVLNAIRKADLTVNDIDLLISHQANIQIIKKGILDLGLDMGKTYTTIEKYGNTSSASIPITLDDALKNKKIKKGDVIVFVAFGTGVSWGAIVIKWAF